MKDIKENGFFAFLIFVFFLLFLILKSGFLASLVVSFLLCAFIRFCWFLYNVLFNLIGGVDHGRIKTKKKREV